MTKERMSKIDKIDLIKIFIKAFIKSLKRSLQRIDFRSFMPHRKIIKHAFGMMVIMLIIVAMALPNSIAADVNTTAIAADSAPAVMSEEEALEASIREFTVYGMYLNDGDGEEVAVTASQPVGDIANNGYPYAKKAEEGVTLAIKLSDAVTNATFQWQRSDDKEQWSDLDGETNQTFENKVLNFVF